MNRKGAERRLGPESRPQDPGQAQGEVLGILSDACQGGTWNSSQRKAGIRAARQGHLVHHLAIFRHMRRTRRHPRTSKELRESGLKAEAGARECPGMVPSPVPSRG